MPIIPILADRVKRTRNLRLASSTYEFKTSLGYLF